MLHILPGDEKREEKTDTVSMGASSAFQRQKAAKLKASALGAGQHSWNALFLGPNAIADTLAAQLGTSKADLLDTGGETRYAWVNGLYSRHRMEGHWHTVIVSVPEFVWLSGRRDWFARLGIFFSRMACNWTRSRVPLLDAAIR
jgi:hypothetical protein